MIRNGSVTLSALLFLSRFCNALGVTTSVGIGSRLFAETNQVARFATRAGKQMLTVCACQRTCQCTYQHEQRRTEAAKPTQHKELSEISLTLGRFGNAWCVTGLVTLLLRLKRYISVTREDKRR